MSDKTNDEKLRILQERLAQIKQKKDTPSTPRQAEEKETEVTTSEIEDPQKGKTPISFKWLTYIIIIIGIGYGAFYAYKNEIKLIDSNSLKSEKTDIKEIDVAEKTLKYNLNFEGQDNIAIAGTFEDENAAKAMVNDLKVKGFKTDYFYLPNKSNSTKKLYKVFIGPYENKEETNQWVENLEVDFEIISL
ncbi:MAG: SPOR domain-containing protein [Bacteroidota bacterium]|nr:SPOR domain-containing protein [Bacteroidota bacterium]